MYFQCKAKVSFGALSSYAQTWNQTTLSEASQPLGWSVPNLKSSKTSDIPKTKFMFPGGFSVIFGAGQFCCRDHFLIFYKTTDHCSPQLLIKKRECLKAPPFQWDCFCCPTDTFCPLVTQHTLMHAEQWPSRIAQDSKLQDIVTQNRFCFQSLLWIKWL